MSPSPIPSPTLSVWPSIRTNSPEPIATVARGPDGAIQRSSGSRAAHTDSAATEAAIAHLAKAGIRRAAIGGIAITFGRSPLISP